MEVFNGRNSPEIFREYHRWLYWITDVFLPMIDSEKGDFLFLPYEGGILDQPYQTMQILTCIQSCYREVQHEKIKRMQKNSPASPTRRKRPHR